MEPQRMAAPKDQFLVGLLDQGAEEPALDLQAGLMDERLDLVGEMLVLVGQGQGHPQAEDNYGLALFQNNKRAQAVPWLEKSANRGEPRAQFVLGTMYFNGDGVERDWVRAYALIVRSSQSGLPQASAALAQMDKYISLQERQQGLALARQYEDMANRPRPTVDYAANTPRPTTQPPRSTRTVRSSR